MDNALKFTPKGGMVVLNLESGDSDVNVTVSDTDPRIKESEQVQLFERYQHPKEPTIKKELVWG